MKKMCPECYSDYSRITPLTEPEDCLKNHLQYVCQTCGRCICANRGLFPFKSLDIAKLYLRSAEAMKCASCGIYELEAFYPKMTKRKRNRKTYKIFKDTNEFEIYLKKNKNKKADSFTPQFKSSTYISEPNKRLRKLKNNEIANYLKEKENQSDQWIGIVKELLK